MSVKSSKPSIAVIGAGVIGLSTAVCIQETLPSTGVTIIADKFLNETLSFGAGGLFRPEANIGTSLATLKEWAKNSYDRFQDIAFSTDANDAGMQLVSGFHLNSFNREVLNNNILAEIIPNFREMVENEYSMFPKKFKYGVFYTTIITDPRYYLPWLMKKFNSNGGKIIHKHLNTIEEVSDYDIVVNCSGLNAKFLVNDWKMTPVRGQTIKVKAPWIKHFYYGDNAYICPGRDYVTMGGIKEYGDWNINVNESDRQWIWKQCTELVPSLSNAEICYDWVGLRPQRQPVRVEKEIIETNFRNHTKHNMKVVHNYGHGGHGVTLSWGTAKHATQLVKELLENNNINNVEINSKL